MRRAGNGWLGLEDLSEDGLMEHGVAEQLSSLSRANSTRSNPAPLAAVRVEEPLPARRMSTTDITTHYW